MSLRSIAGIYILLVTAFSGGCASLTPSRPASSGSIVINEVLYWELSGAGLSEQGHEWVEIHNKGRSSQLLSGWTLIGQSGAILAELPAVELPAGAYLVVHFTDGVDDLDVTDNRGDLYVPQVGPVFNDSQDEVGLFNGQPGAGTAVDFINWKANDSQPVVAGVAQRLAIDAGIWQADTFFDSSRYQGQPYERVRTVQPGTTIGRDKDSTDTNAPVDWDAHGGRDALTNTPRRRNLAVMNLIIPPPPPPPAEVEWTFMVYIDGDNNLEPAAFDDLTEIEQTIDSNDVNVVVMIDGLSAITEVERIGGTLRPVPGRPKGATWRGQIKQDADPDLVLLYPAAADAAGGYFLGERNLGDPVEIQGFVAWAKANYPARKYALVIWDHGLGWKGVSYDETSSDDALRIGEIGTALNGAGVDLVGFDACLMGMIEVAQQAVGAAGVFVASEEVEDFDGWPYDTLLADLKANPAMSAAQLGSVIVNRYSQFYTAVSPDPLHTLSAIDLGAGFTALVQDVSAFGAEMTPAIDDIDKPFVAADNEQIDIVSARVNTEEFNDTNFVDLSDLARQIGISPLRGQYKTRAQPIVDRLVPGGGVVIAERHGADHTDSRGLSIYFPRFQTKSSGSAPGCSACGSPDSAGDPFDDPFTEQDKAGSQQVIYAEDLTIENGAVPYFGRSPHPHPQAPGFAFPMMTNWDEFLHRYYKPAADAGQGDAYLWGSMVTLDGRGSSDSDGDVIRWSWDLHSGRDEPPVLGGGACLAGPEDAECDRRDEENDDPELDGPVVTFECLEPEFDITLSVHDDHSLQHRNHWKTDQSITKVTCVPCTKRVEEKYVIPGRTFTWNIDMVNPGELETEVQVIDSLPEGLELINAQSETFDVKIEGTRVTATGRLKSQARERLELEVVLDPGYDKPYIYNRSEYRYWTGTPAVCEDKVPVVPGH